MKAKGFSNITETHSSHWVNSSPSVLPTCTSTLTKSTFTPTSHCILRPSTPGHLFHISKPCLLLKQDKSEIWEEFGGATLKYILAKRCVFARIVVSAVQHALNANVLMPTGRNPPLLKMSGSHISLSRLRTMKRFSCLSPVSLTSKPLYIQIGEARAHGKLPRPRQSSVLNTGRRWDEYLGLHRGQ